MDQPTGMDGTEVKSAWKPLDAIERRVLGVLVEKAKTTPDAYPLSLNALCSGCNQKSNRYPKMELDEEQVQDAVDRLRAKDAVAEVQGGGRVPRFRHYGREWFAVDGKHLAVMAELLLRGQQTVGELRARAARMEPIAGLSELQPILETLKARKLVIGLTPEGRGHMITHGLYQGDELDRVRKKVAASVDSAVDSPPPAATSPRVSAPVQHSDTPPPPLHQGQANAEVAALRSDVESLKQQVAKLRQDLEDVWSNLR